MTKYKLKKDLFGVEVGTVFDETESENGYHCVKVYVTSDFSAEFRTGTALFDVWFEKIDEDYKPEKDEKYYYANGCAQIRVTSWRDNWRDDARYEIGNTFETEEETKEAIEWLKARKTLIDDTKGFKVTPGESRCQVIYSYDDDYKYLSVRGTELDCLDANDFIAFENMLDAEESIKKHKAEWLTYLRVKKGE